MDTPKSKALASLMKEIMDKFISKDLGEEGHEAAETPDEEIKEQAKLEELNHPQMGEGEAQDVAKQHLMDSIGDGDKDELGHPDMQDKGPGFSMSILAAKKPNPFAKKEGKVEYKGKKKGK